MIKIRYLGPGKIIEGMEELVFKKEMNILIPIIKVTNKNSEIAQINKDYACDQAGIFGKINILIGICDPADGS